MRPFVIRGHVWRVARVMPGDPLLMDDTGVLRPATCDHRSRTIWMSTSIPIDMFDKVLLHEVAHAIMWETRLSDLLSLGTGTSRSEELLAWFLETHATEAIGITTTALGRGVCVDDICVKGY